MTITYSMSSQHVSKKSKRLFVNFGSTQKMHYEEWQFKLSIEGSIQVNSKLTQTFRTELIIIWIKIFRSNSPKLGPTYQTIYYIDQNF